RARLERREERLAERLVRVPLREPTRAEALGDVRVRRPEVVEHVARDEEVDAADGNAHAEPPEGERRRREPRDPHRFECERGPPAYARRATPAPETPNGSGMPRTSAASHRYVSTSARLSSGGVGKKSVRRSGAMPNQRRSVRHASAGGNRKKLV